MDEPSMKVVFTLRCVCWNSHAGKPCQAVSEFTSGYQMAAVRKARRAGWLWRSGLARCPDCGRRGASFPKHGKA